MDIFTNEQIIKIINQYKNKKDKEKIRYDTKLKFDSEYKTLRNERSRIYYQNNKDIIKEKYKKDKAFRNARQILYYYKSNNNVELFKTKHADKLKLVEHLLESPVTELKI
tara:strand:- start:13686 stop:14015 length:330 start_codon:yes stop_codon:yes gene_type:complete